MSLTDFLRLLYRNWKWLVSLPLAALIVVFVLVGMRDREYRSSLQIYTGFASGYNITNPENNKIDFYSVNNSIDNLISTIQNEVVLEKVGLTLFAQSMIYGQRGDHKYITEESYLKLREIVPDSIVAIIDPTSVKNSVDTLQKYLTQSSHNFVYELIHLYHPNYSLWALSKVEVKRMGNSDIVQIGYTSNDPALCQQTLIILGEEFVKYYQSYKESQTHDVVQYFEDQRTAAAERLGLAEDKFMEYSKENRVINYYEQTKAIAGQLQAFELDYDKVLTLNAGARKSVAALEHEIELHTNFKARSKELLDLRSQIAERTADIAAKSIFMDDSSYVRFDGHKFDAAVSAGQQVIRKRLDTMELFKNTPEGIEIDNILDRWLENVIKYDASSEALAVLDKRRNEINKQYDFFAPIGATVKRQEREIGINESEYLSLLHSLSLAKLQKQNAEMSSSYLRVIDEPIYPIQAESNKRKLLSVMAFIVTFVLIMALILLIEFLDKTLRDATRAKRFSGLDVISLLPINHTYSESCFEQKDDLAFSQLMTQIIRLRKEGLPLVINLLSFEPREGKSYVASHIAERFTTMGYRTMVLTANVDFSPLSKSYVEAQTIRDLAPVEEYDLYIVEFASMNLSIVPPALLRSSSLNLLIARARRAWHISDRMLVEGLRRGSTEPPYMVLNGVEEEALEVFTGELPKRRSKFRIFIKRLATREYTSKSGVVPESCIKRNGNLN